MNPDREMAPFYTDPLHEQLDALENSVEWFHDPAALSPPGLGDDLDPLGQALGQVEESIEWTTVPPLRPFGEPEPPPVQPGPPAPIVYGSFGQTPPASQEPRGKPWGMIEPPSAARPYLTHDGLTNRPYHPQFGGSTGIRNNAGSSEKWCARDQCAVDEEEDCPSCDDFGDHDDEDVERCRYE